MPLAEECMQRLAGSKWLSKIDLQSAFFSLPLAENARDKTAFMTRVHGLLRFTALPMGLTTAPQKFQRAVDDARESIKAQGPNDARALLHVVREVPIAVDTDVVEERDAAVIL